MRQHTGKVEAGQPFPRVLMLPRSAPLRCSKRKDPASIFRQTRRADHDLTHAFTVFVNCVRESRPRYPLNRAKQSAASARVRHPIISIFSDRVTALHGDLPTAVDRSGISWLASDEADTKGVRMPAVTQAGSEMPTVAAWAASLAPDPLFRRHRQPGVSCLHGVLCTEAPRRTGGVSPRIAKAPSTVS